MKSILDVRIKDGKPYFKDGLITKMFDGFKIKEEVAKEIKLFDKKVVRVSIPPNYHRSAYSYNVLRAVGNTNWSGISVKGNRIYDIDFLSDFQKSIIAFGIIKSISIILINNQRSIKNSVIGIEDGGNIKNLPIIKECAKYTKRILLIAENFKSASEIRNYVIANYGVSPEITMNKKEFKYVDFIITEKNKKYDTLGVWYLDSFYEPKYKNNVIINDVSFSINSYNDEISPELLGVLIKPDRTIKDYIEDYLINNKVILSKIKFGNKDINLKSY